MSSSGAEAGERRIRLSGSGKISGSSHGPCTTNGNSNPEALLRLATPFMSYSRVGTEAVPVSVIFVAGPSTRMSSAVATPSENFTAMVRLVYGVEPLRKLPPPDSGRRSSRLRSCSALKPAIAPSCPVTVALPSSDCTRPNGLDPEARSETLILPRPDSLLSPNNSVAQAWRSTSVNWNCALMSATVSDRAMPNEPFAIPP